MAAGFVFEPSKTDTYWSNQETMRKFVVTILVPYFARERELLGLPASQESMWTLDAYTVHRSPEFLGWMRRYHATIHVDFVPGGTTGVAQPCDVGIQRPLKLSARRSYHEDVVNDFVAQLESGADEITVDKRVGGLRNRSVRWLVNAYKTINNEELVKKVMHSPEHIAKNTHVNHLTPVLCTLRCSPMEPLIRMLDRI